MAQKDEVVVEVKDVFRFYGKRSVLSGVSLVLLRGEVFGFLGPNGAGKSTLMKIIMGVEEADKGTVLFSGKSFNRQTKARIGIVPQEDFIYKQFSVRENLYFFGLLNNVYGKKLAKRVDFLIKWLGLGAFAQTRGEFLSGGYRKLLNIGCSIVHDPEVVFMDEPTVALDPLIRAGIWDKIREMKKQKKTICLTTHYLDEAQSLCDRIAIISNGKIIAQDTPENLVEKYGGKEAIRFRLDQQDTLSAVEKLRQEFSQYSVEEHKGEIVILVPKKGSFLALGKISGFLEKNSFSVVSSTVKEPGIDEAFLSLTKEDAK